MKIAIPFAKNEINETMEDYLRWRGDLSFEAAPFNLIDNMVLCELSYVDFKKVVPVKNEEGISLRELGRKIQKKDCYKLLNLYGGHEDFIYAVCESFRFGNLIVKNYVDIFEKKDNVQFSAIEFVLNPKLSYIAYRGTDASLVGWKEDFMLSFTRIKAQEYAKDYLQKVMKPRHTYYVGGHSKGGNLALYACAWLSEKQLDHVLRIYDNDGPGFDPEAFDLKKLEKLGNKVTQIEPEFCVIGKLMEVKFPDVHIVRSNETGANQHDIISWRMNGIQLDEIDAHDKASDWLDETIAQWVAGVNHDERKTFVDETFQALAAGGATTMQEVFNKGLPEVVKAMAASSSTSKKVAFNLAEAAVLGKKKK